MAKFRSLTIPTVPEIKTTSRQYGARYEIDLVTDDSGREFFSKDVHKGGGYPLAQELLGHLTARVLDVPVPDFGVEKTRKGYNFLSRKEPNWTDLDDAYGVPIQYQYDDLYRIEGMLAIYKIGDNHRGNFLVNHDTGHIRKIDMEFMLQNNHNLWDSNTLGLRIPYVEGASPARRQTVWHEIHDLAKQRKVELYRVIDIADQFAIRFNHGFNYPDRFNFRMRAERYLDKYLKA